MSEPSQDQVALVNRVARAIITTLASERYTYVGDADGMDCVCVDGHFDILNVARAAIAAMTDATA